MAPAPPGAIPNTVADRLRALPGRRRLPGMPCRHGALRARLIVRAGFDLAVLSRFGASDLGFDACLDASGGHDGAALVDGDAPPKDDAGSG